MRPKRGHLARFLLGQREHPAGRPAFQAAGSRAARPPTCVAGLRDFL